MNNVRVLILGGSGFLGSALARRLLAQNVKVGSADIRPSPISDVTFVPFNILDQANTQKAITGWDVLINCVGQVSKPIALCEELNSKGMQTLAHAVKSTGQ